MKTLLVSILLLFTALAGWWLIGALKTKSSYDALLKQERATSFAVAAMDEESKALLSDVQRNWRRKEDANTEISQLLTALGLTPSVTNVIQMLHSPMPRFSFWSASRDRQAVMVAYMKLAYSNFGMHQMFHVSDDGHLALLWCSSNTVIVFQDETNGVREAWYFKVK